jgi:hypothetical protein
MTNQIDNLIGTIRKARWSNRTIRVSQIAPMKKFVSIVQVEQQNGVWVDVANTDRVIKTKSVLDNYMSINHATTPTPHKRNSRSNIKVGAIYKSTRNSTKIQIVGISPLFNTVDVVEVYFCNGQWKAIPTTQRSTKVTSLICNFKLADQIDQPTNYIYKARRSRHLIEVVSIDGDVVKIHNVDDNHNAIAGSTRQIKRSSLETSYKAIQPK